jgi:hypothetical protein
VNRPTCPECGFWQGHAGDCLTQPDYEVAPVPLIVVEATREFIEKYREALEELG